MRQYQSRWPHALISPLRKEEEEEEKTPNFTEGECEKRGSATTKYGNWLILPSLALLTPSKAARTVF